MRRVKEKEDITELVCRYVPPVCLVRFPSVCLRPTGHVRGKARRASLRAEKSTAARVHVLLPVEWSRMQKAVPEITTCPRALDAQS